MDKDQKLHNLRHSAAHLLAAAMQELYPGVKFGIGPVIENGFYYDFDLPKPISDEELLRIENKMAEIRNKKLDLVRSEEEIDSAQDIEKDQPYKKELISDLEKEGNKDVSFYTLGEFKDLCAGPHVENTSEIGPFKLLSVAGAYWKGSEKNRMLTRIYGTAFETKEELENHLNMLEEAKKRDHKKLGKELELFMFHETAPGMPYWLPNGVILYNQLVEFWREEHKKRGYLEVVSPLANKKELYETSGHYEHYWQDMFHFETEEGEEYALKAMNCPNAMLLFKYKLRSYRELPLRLSDVDTLHRNELSGTLNGLFRVREFRQDDAHIFVAEEQIESEFKSIFEITERFYSIFGMEYSFRLSTRPDGFMGEIETWNKAEADLKKILDDSGKKYIIGEKEGAFYGPKIDILMKDALGREWQMGTIQLDFQMPERFGLEYVDADGKMKTPVVIHRVIYGSVDRFLGVLIEHLGGSFPVWLSPIQAKIIPITDRHNEYAQKVFEQLNNSGIRVELDSRSEKMQAKIRDAQLQKIPYMLILGDREQESGTVAVRSRTGEDLGAIKVDEFLAKVKDQIATRSQL